MSSGQIFGHVLDSDGNAIVGVPVHADDGFGDIFSNSTDVNGFYSIVVADGNWDVSVDCTQLNSLGYQCIGSTKCERFGQQQRAGFHRAGQQSVPAFHGASWFHRV